MLVVRVDSSARPVGRPRRGAAGKGNQMKISVIGLGKLGAPLAAVLASKGHSVIGVDVNRDFARLLTEGKAPVEEPGLQKLLDQHRARLSATTDFETAILGSDVSFVIVPTPSD